MHDVCILGAGPAGLNAALILGRCGRDVLVLDSGKPRNGVSRALHGFLSRDGTPPLELRELGRAELAAYPTVNLRQSTEAQSVLRHDGFFELVCADGFRAQARVLLLATGRIDLIPTKPGFREYYGLVAVPVENAELGPSWRAMRSAAPHLARALHPVRHRKHAA